MYNCGNDTRNPVTVLISWGYTWTTEAHHWPQARYRMACQAYIFISDINKYTCFWPYAQNSGILDRRQCPIRFVVENRFMFHLMLKMLLKLNHALKADWFFSPFVLSAVNLEPFCTPCIYAVMLRINMWRRQRAARAKKYQGQMTCYDNENAHMNKHRTWRRENPHSLKNRHQEQTSITVSIGHRPT